MPVTDTKYVEIRKNRRGEDRAYIAGTRVRIRDIYAHSEIHGESPEEIVAALPHLTLAHVHAALSYYFENRETILDEIRRDDEFVRLMRNKLGPGPLERKLKGTDTSDAISSR
jgi:uncharacterized protein (DUF433 family)